MSNPPRFQYNPRWTEIIPLLTSGDEEQVRTATAILEERDRWLEDHWPAGGGAGVGATTYSSQWGDSVADITGSWATFSSITLTLDEPTTFMVWALAVGNTDGAVVAGTRITMQALATSHIGPYATAAPQGTNKFYYELYTQGALSLDAGSHTVQIQVREEDGGTDFYITRTELHIMTTTLAP